MVEREGLVLFVWFEGYSGLGVVRKSSIIVGLVIVVWFIVIN